MLIALAVGCNSPSNIDRAIDRGIHFLESRQDADGAWRAGSHGVFRDGTGLTPHVLVSLNSVGRKSDSFAAGKKWIDQIDSVTLSYPTYGDADLSRIGPPNKWIERLRSQQLHFDENGDPRVGGWAYPAPPLADVREGNTSSTAYAVCALRDGGIDASDPALVSALKFILHSQNDDGGFTFGPESANKAGATNSYGSATADGLRAMLACGLPPRDSHVTRATDWLKNHFDVESIPGEYTPDRAPLRNGNYFYYLAVLTDAFERAHVDRSFWSGPIADALLQRQLPDGSWRNDISSGKEDEPLVATGLALQALARCAKR